MTASEVALATQFAHHQYQIAVQGRGGLASFKTFRDMAKAVSNEDGSVEVRA